MTKSFTVLGADGNDVTVSEVDDRSAVVIAIQQNDERGRVSTVRLDKGQFDDFCGTKYHIEVEAVVPHPGRLRAGNRIVNTANLKEKVALDKEKAQCNKRLKEIEERLSVLDEVIANEFIEDGMQSVNIDGRTVYLHADVYASPKDGDRGPVIEALQECDLGQYVRPDYNANSLKAYVREMIHEAEERARVDGTVLDDPAKAIPEKLAATLKVSTVWAVSSRKA